MKILRIILVIAVCLFVGSIPLVTVRSAWADTSSVATPVGLSIAELKITGDELVLLQNNTGTDIPNLGIYWLSVFNNVNPLAANVSSSQQQLPAVPLLAGQTLLLSANPAETCGASVAGKLSVSLGDTGGFLQIDQMGLSSDGRVVQTPGDFTSWSSGANGVLQNIPSNTKDPRALFYRFFNGVSYAWQQADTNANSCQLTMVVAGGPGSSSAVTPLTLAATSPPATILGAVSNSTGSSAASLPAADIGLLAPQISELLPNPMGTGNDATAEFIELYNPNAQPFDLTGFTLQTGLTTAHSYIFPPGTTLEASSFHAFYASVTKLTLSNTTSQAVLLDPFGKVLSQTDTYTNAKDGLAWAMANSKWYWTLQVTPNVANIIQQPATTTKTANKTSSPKTAVKGISTNTPNGNGTTSTAAVASSSGIIHWWVLALVATLALLYGAYEYRRDLGNRLYRLGAKFGFGSATRRAAKGRRSD